MKTALALTAAIALAACASTVPAGRDGGIATYDALKAAQAACAAKGRVLRLKRHGDAQYLDDYACEKD